MLKILDALRRRARRAATGDAGISLMELVMAMVLSTGLGAVTVFFFISVDDSSARTTDRTINTANARNVLEAWTSYLQVSDGTSAGSSLNRFEWFTPSDVLFYANLDNRATSTDSATAPTMLWLRLDSTGHLIEEQFTSTSVAGSGPAICRRLADSTSAGIATAAQLFTPRSVSGTDLSGDDLGAAPTSGDGCQALPETPPSAMGGVDVTAVANLQTVNTVEIAFTVVDTKGAHPLEFDSIVTLPSLGATS